MKALVYRNNKIEFIEKESPKIISPQDVILKVTLSSICTSDLHIVKGFVPQAKEGIIPTFKKQSQHHEVLLR